MKLNMEPRFDLGWNSAKYDQITGPLPPSLKKSRKIVFKMFDELKIKWTMDCQRVLAIIQN